VLYMLDGIGNSPNKQAKSAHSDRERLAIFSLRSTGLVSRPNRGEGLVPRGALAIQRLFFYDSIRHSNSRAHFSFSICFRTKGFGQTPNCRQLKRFEICLAAVI